MFINMIVRKIKSTATNDEFIILRHRARHYGYNLIQKRPLDHS